MQVDTRLDVSGVSDTTLMLERVRHTGLAALVGDGVRDLRRQFFDHPTVAWIEAKADQLGLGADNQEQLGLILDAWMVEHASDRDLQTHVLPMLRSHAATLEGWTDNRLLALWRECAPAVTAYIVGAPEVPRTPAIPTVPGTADQLTPDLAKALLQAHFGGRAVDTLIKAGKLSIVATVDELPASIRAAHSTKLDYIAGATTGDNNVYLVANRTSASQLPGLFLHEVGEHAGLASMLGKDYGRLSAHFNRLLAKGDVYADWAAKRVPHDTPSQYVPSEQLAYLVERVANDAAARPGGDEGYALGQTCLEQLRTWLFRTPLGKWMDESGQLDDFTLRPTDLASLAREGVDHFVRGFDPDAATANRNQWMASLDQQKLEDLYAASSERHKLLENLSIDQVGAYLYALTATHAPNMAATLERFHALLCEMAAGRHGQHLTAIAGETLALGRASVQRSQAREQIGRTGFALWMDKTSSVDDANLRVLKPAANPSQGWQLTHYRRDLGEYHTERFTQVDAALRTLTDSSHVVADSDAPSVLDQWKPKASEAAAPPAKEGFDSWFQDSRAINDAGEPLVLYHGTGADFSVFNDGSIWASATPALASEYAEYRGESSSKAASVVMPVYMQAKQPFDGDRLPRDLTVAAFFYELVNQAKSYGHAYDEEQASALLNHVRGCARREESGPHYNPQQFWNSPQMFFGRDGAASIQSALRLMGFDSIRFTERGHLTYGVFDATQVKSAIGNVGSYTPMSRDIRFAFGGVQAQGIDLQGLQQAQLMHRRGDDIEAVRQATGWHLGPEGKWRFEIDDSKARLADDGWFRVGEFNGRPVEKMIGTIGDELVTLNPSAAAQLGYSHKRVPGLLEHPQLFSLYPQLASLRVEIVRCDGFEVASFGEYLPSQNLIRVQTNPALGGDGLNVLLHELQHAVQRVEQFARGGNITMFDPEPEPGPYRKQLQEILHVDDLAKENGVTPLFFAQNAGCSAEFVEQVAKWQAAGQWERHVAFASQRLSSPLSNYRRLAGEVEARNVQTRQHLSEAERRAISPAETVDVSADAMIVWDSGIETRAAALDNYVTPVGSTGAEAFAAWFANSQVVDATGAPLVLYHGTASDFTEFDHQSHRSLLNEQYQGDGFHFSADPAVASEYADSARNNLINKARVFAAADESWPPRVAQIFKRIVEHGFVGGWDLPREEVEAILSEAGEAGIDINDVTDLCQYVEGAFVPDDVEPLALFGDIRSYMPEHVRDTAVALGIDSALPNPLVMPVFVSAQRVLHTSDREAARRAREDGYDAVCYSGTDIVGGVAEWIVYEPSSIKSAIGNQGTFAPSDPDIRFSFAGEQAASAPLEELAHAKQLKDQGADADVIWSSTGWYVGMDGRWRFEISDGQADLNEDRLKSLYSASLGTSLITSVTYHRRDDGTYDLVLMPSDARLVSDFVSLYAIGEERLSSMLPAEVVRAIRAGEGHASIIGTSADLLDAHELATSFPYDALQTLHLEEVLSHPALFAAYPQLRSMPVAVDMSRDVGGYLSFTQGRWQISLGRYAGIGTLLHEIQHAIQELENFAKGGSAKVVREVAYPELDGKIEQLSLTLDRYINERSDIATALVARLSDEDKQRLLLHPQLSEHLAELYEGDANDEFWSDACLNLDEYCGPDDLPSIGATWYYEVAAINNRIKDTYRVKSGLQQQLDRFLFEGSQQTYMRLPGEIEARNVSNRHQFPDSVRRTMRPDTTQDIASADAFLFWHGNSVAFDEHGQVNHSVSGKLRDSKVVDADGQPLVMYHGTRTDFDEFGKEHIGSNYADSVGGFFFTGSKALASQYAMSRGGNGGYVRPVLLDIKNPLTLETYLWSIAETKESALTNRGIALSDLFDEDGAGIVEYAKQAGHDGIFWSNSGDLFAVAFEPEQIKPALGASNGPIQRANMGEQGNRAKGQNAFDRWFGRSKVVDASGAPLVVYHGTSVDGTTYNTPKGKLPDGAFTEFDPEWLGSVSDSSDSKAGFWFSASRERAVSASHDAQDQRGGSAYVYETFLSIQNPAIYADIRDYSPAQVAELAKDAKAKSHDGLLFEKGEAGGADYLVFEPGQIKSAIANVGSFDPAVPDIRFSNDNEEAQRETGFTGWFGQSKVVDASGAPLVVYHGTRADQPIDAFDLSRAGQQTDAGWMGEGFYFGSKNSANVYSGHNEFEPNHFPENGAVYPVYLSLNNPAVLVDSERNDGPRTMVRELLDLPDEATPQQVRQELLNAGYDGVIYERFSPYGTGYKEYVALHPEQIKSAIGNVGTFDPGNQDIRFSFAGERALNAPALALADARLQLSQGIDREEIRQATGWFLGHDQKWRFEIDDSQCTVLPNSPLKAWEGDVPLDQVIDHPVLFAAYPELRTVGVSLEEDIGFRFTQASYNPELRHIRLTTNNPGQSQLTADQLSALLHETQHALQQLESFATGASPRDETLPSTEAMLKRINEQYRALKDQAMQSPEYLEHIETGLAVFPASERYREGRKGTYDYGRTVVENDAYERFVAPIDDQRMAKIDRMLAHRGFLEPDGSRRLAYMHIAGEVEARNVQARQALTAEQRVATAPDLTEDVDAEDIIVRFEEPVEVLWNGQVVASTMVTSAAPRQTDTKEFREWFADSAIVDALGEPLVCYHGTDADFTAFKQGAAYFTPRQDYSYVQNSAVVVPVYLSLRNPYRPTNQSEIEQIRSNPERVAQLQAQGYDGVLWAKPGNIMRGASGWGDDYPQIVTFSPEQVKSAIGNNGDFSASKADIRFSLGAGPRLPERQTDTPAFRQWFGKSHTLDGNGDPQVYYHGTYAGEIDAFDRLKSTQWRRPSMDTVGTWFSDQPGIGGAEKYAQGPAGAVYPVYLRAERTKNYDRFDDFLRDMHEAEGRVYEDQSPKGVGSTEGLRAKLKAQGYDSIGFTRTYNAELAAEVEQMLDAVRRAKDEEYGVSRDEREPYTAKRLRLEESLARLRAEQSDQGYSTEFDGQNVLVVFEPEQIKSAIGNAGTFSRDTADIRFSEVEQTTRLPLAERPAFQQWFKSSQITDQQGAPLVVYHGTGRDFSVFDKGQIGSASDEFKKPTDAFWFSDNVDAAELFASFGDNPVVMPMYLRMENPLVVDCAAWARRFDSLHEAFRFGSGGIAYNIEYFKRYAVIEARQQGCDGVIFRGGYDGRPVEGATIYAALEPGQMKSAIGNIGNYNRLHNDIRYRLEQSDVSEQFRGWFGTSKIVDDRALPLVIYHAADSSDGGYVSRAGMLGHAIYCASQPGNITGDQQSGQIIVPVYASILNPMIFDTPDDLPFKTLDTARLVALGYDGVLIKRASRSAPEGDSPFQVAAFSASQLKSALNEDGSIGFGSAAQPRLRLNDSPAAVAQKQEAAEQAQAEATGLDMSQNARMSRARELGFDTDKIWYHGTEKAGFKSFETQGKGKTEGTGAFFASTTSMARSYSGTWDDVPLASGLSLFDNPGQVDALEIDSLWVMRNRYGSVIAEGSAVTYPTAEQWLDAEGYDLEDDATVEQVFSAYYDESIIEYGTREETIAALDEHADWGPGNYAVYVRTKDLLVIDWQSRGWSEGPEENVWQLLDEDDDVIETFYDSESAHAALEDYPDSRIHENTESFYETTDSAARFARDAGYDGVLFQNVIDCGSKHHEEEGDVMVVFDASNIRSVNAAFDPAFSSNSDIRLSQRAESVPAPDTVDHPFGEGLYLSKAALERSAAALGLDTENWYQGEPLTLARTKRLVSDRKTPEAVQNFLRTYRARLAGGENIELLVSQYTASMHRKMEAVERSIDALRRGESQPLTAQAYSHQLEMAKGDFGWFITHLDDFKQRRLQAGEHKAFLNLDLPLSAQSAQVREALELIGIDGHMVVACPAGNTEFMSRIDATHHLARLLEAGTKARLVETFDAVDPMPNGADVYQHLTELLGGTTEASQLLQSSGIRGLRYDSTTTNRTEAFIVFGNSTLPASVHPTTGAIALQVGREGGQCHIHDLDDLSGVKAIGSFVRVMATLRDAGNLLIAKLNERVNLLEERAAWLGKVKDVAPEVIACNAKSLKEAQAARSQLTGWKAPTLHNCLPWDQPVPNGLIKRLQGVLAVKPQEELTGKAIFHLIGATLGSNLKAQNALIAAGIVGAYSQYQTVLWDGSSKTIAAHHRQDNDATSQLHASQVYQSVKQNVVAPVKPRYGESFHDSLNALGELAAKPQNEEAFDSTAVSSAPLSPRKSIHAGIR